jgi:twitching motility protein PilT
MIDSLVRIIQSNGASDVHISAGRHIYIRINGELIELVSEPIYETTDVVRLLVEFVGEEKGRKVVNKTEVDFSYTKNGIRVRGHAFVSSGRISIALRVIEKVRTLEELNLPTSLYRLVEQKQGFILFVGPMGQGKSTTMAALLNHVNTTRHEHIVTIEDPIEYVFDSAMSIVDQRELDVDTVSFSVALRAAFREDANIVMVGEMRDLETIETAVTIAETGHLILSTLHTNSAAQTIDRIIDMFPPERQNQMRAQLSSSLLAIFSQRLIPSQLGGRKPAYELLINNSAIANLIREGRTHEIETVLQTSRSEGMIDMNTSLIELVNAGHLTVEDAMHYTTNQKSFLSLIR